MDQPLPSDLSLPATGGVTFSFSAQRGQFLVLYFYPKDNTPGCTLEGSEFRDLYPQFQALGCRVFGVSRDGLASHERFNLDSSVERVRRRGGAGVWHEATTPRGRPPQGGATQPGARTDAQAGVERFHPQGEADRRRKPQCSCGLTQEYEWSTEESRFKARLGLPFELIADTDALLCRHFGVLKQKQLYGRQVIGIERSTWLFDAGGQPLHVWRGVKAAHHARAVLDFIADIKNKL